MMGIGLLLLEGHDLKAKQDLLSIRESLTKLYNQSVQLSALHRIALSIATLQWCARFSSA